MSNLIHRLKSDLSLTEAYEAMEEAATRIELLEGALQEAIDYVELDSEHPPMLNEWTKLLISRV